MSNTDRPSNVSIEKILRELADAADAISIDFFHRQNELTIEQKSDGSFVTTADKAVEAELRRILQSVLKEPKALKASMSIKSL